MDFRVILCLMYVLEMKEQSVRVRVTKAFFCSEERWLVLNSTVKKGIKENRNWPMESWRLL